MISEMEIKCVQPIITCLVERCCTGLVLKGLKKPAKKLLTYCFFPGKRLNSKPSTYEAACRSFECANPSGFLFLSPSHLQMFS